MGDQDRYVMLMSSMPRSERLFLAKQPPLSRIRLDRRLRVLEEEDARMLDQVERVLGWGRKTMSMTDEQVIAHARAALPQITSETLSLIVRNRLEMRTIIAALRRRKRGDSAPSEETAWGFGRWMRRISANWSEPSFRLDSIYPWVREAAQLIERDDTVGFERLVLDNAYRDLQRHGAGHEFDIEAVVIYVLKWNIFDRWARAVAEDASKRFEELALEGLGEYAVLQFEGET